MCVLTIGSFSHVANKLKTDGNTLVESWFGFFSLISDFNLNYSSRITFWAVGDHFQVLKVLKGTYTFRGWGTTSRFLKCLKVHVRYCIPACLLYGTTYSPLQGDVKKRNRRNKNLTALSCSFGEQPLIS